MNTIHATNPLTKGHEVAVAQRFLIQRGFLPAGADDGVAGPATLHGFVLAKRHYGYPKKDQTPACGDRLIEALRTGKSPFHVHLPHPIHHNDFEVQVRNRLAVLMDAGVANEHKIHYAMTRPIAEHTTIDVWEHHECTFDCSGSFTWLCKAAGLPHDPNGSDWNGLGYTGTLMAHMRPITKAQLEVGDAIIFGAYPGHHVVMCRKPGPDPKIFSHGQEKGPWYTTLSNEAQYQPAVIHYYSIF